MTIDEEIVEHYNSYDESQRLADGFGNLERERTKELIQRYLPTLPATVLDIGGAGGLYSFWLAGLGHEVLSMFGKSPNMPIQRAGRGDGAPP